MTVSDLNFGRLDFSSCYLFYFLVGGSFVSEMSKGDYGMSICYIAGIINSSEQRAFEKIIFRTSRGKVLVRFHEQDFTIKDFEGQISTKTAYVLIYQEGAYMQDKIVRVCESFFGKMFALPENG